MIRVPEGLILFVVFFLNGGVSFLCYRDKHVRILFNKFFFGILSKHLYSLSWSTWVLIFDDHLRYS